MAKDELTIVIADDHPIVRHGFRSWVSEDSSLRVVAEAADGEEALRRIRELKPNIAILDFGMPKLNGLEVARKIQEEQLPVAVILLTMHKEEDLFNAAVDSGVLGYVLKENAVEDLLAAVQSAAKGDLFISPLLSNFLLRRYQKSATLAREKPTLADLTSVEREILKLVAQGLTSKEIAERLNISHRTVDNHRFRMAEKLGLHGTHSLVKFAYDNRSRL